jgi:hypothetical protein
MSRANRPSDTGEHITDAHGDLQYIPFPTCNETSLPLTFAYGTPQTQTCTIDILDELYHLLEFFVHSDVPLTCRIPSFPLSPDTSSVLDAGDAATRQTWTPLTIALQGTLQLSHLHLHTNINVLLHTSPDLLGSKDSTSHLIASTAYSVPNTTASAPEDGAKILRNEPLTFTFNIGWIDGDVLPGMVGRPVARITDHSLGFSLLSLCALAASGGVGAIGMLVYERRKSGRSGGVNGILPNVNGVGRSTGYGGYGGYGSYNTGKRD